MQPQFTMLHPNAKDITGQRFNRLVALGPVGRTSSGGVQWLCQCDCGNTPIVTQSLLRRGEIKSCGCFIREVTSQRSKTHGMTKTSVYHTWVDIVRRCVDPRRKVYPDYGGRGISVCDEWRTSFPSFLSYVSQLSHYGEKGYTLDRIDNDGNYEPGNVRWATLSEQHRNYRQNHMLSFRGKTQCLTAWADEIGLDMHVLWRRIRSGWTVERSLTTPLMKSNK